ncbi:MAG: SLC13 family permease [Pseudomonadales bacterium]|nr:SLC13 family permease [Pseudomonadales bacterium]
MKQRNLIHILLALSAGYLISQWVPAETAVQTGLGLFTCIAWLWISEALHISVTALLVPLLASLFGIFSVTQALVNFANPIIFLFMGGFALAAALQKYALDYAFAIKVLNLSRGNPVVAILLLFLITAFLSMWISNTATVAMMLPLTLALLADRDPINESKLFLFALLGLAYSGNLGGMATLIGSPPNAIAASAADIDFMHWLSLGIPAFLTLFPLMLIALYLSIRPKFGSHLTLQLHTQPTEQSAKKRQKYVLAIFLVTATSWVMSSPLSTALGIEKNFDSLVAIIAIVLLISSGCINFKELSAKTDWGILILFGGGLTLSAAMQVSGASAWLADSVVALLPGNNHWLALFEICLFIIFLTELVSNTASAALLVPVFISIAAGLGFSEQAMAVLIALCASCAFMLPVATPPNALVFSSGFIPQQRMLRTGLLLNITFALALSGLSWIISD